MWLWPPLGSTRPKALSERSKLYLHLTSHVLFTALYTNLKIEIVNRQLLEFHTECNH